MDKRKTSLVTGASSGIGLALARVLARNGYNLVLVARNEDKLKEISVALEKQYNIVAHPIAADLAKPEAPETIYTKTEELGIHIETLVNNAGFAEYGLFAQSELKAQLNMIALNIAALTHLTHRYVQTMKQYRFGRILNVASTAAFQPGPLMAVYYASKAYVLSFSEALRNELSDYNIAVTALCPGPTETDFFQKQPKMLGSHLLKRGSLMSANEVSEIGYAALKRNKGVVIPGFRNKVLAFLPRLGPQSLVVKISRWTLERE
jgi:uncharacterized protein